MPRACHGRQVHSTQVDELFRFRFGAEKLLPTPSARLRAADDGLVIWGARGTAREDVDVGAADPVYSQHAGHPILSRNRDVSWR